MYHIILEFTTSGFLVPFYPHLTIMFILILAESCSHNGCITELRGIIYFLYIHGSRVLKKQATLVIRHDNLSSLVQINHDSNAFGKSQNAEYLLKDTCNFCDDFLHLE